MKKRLLSAVLALAMVLTLFPATMLTASAADEATSSSPVSGVTTVQWVNGTDYNKPLEGGGQVSNAWAWQYKGSDGKTYWASSTSLGGLVANTSASGVWYSSISSYVNTNSSGQVTGLKGTSFTLVGDMTLSNVYGATTLQINTFGHNLNIGSGVLNTVNNLTITDTAYTTYGKARGTVSGISRNVGTYTAGTAATVMSASGLTLNVTGAQIDSINLTGRGNTVTLTDAVVTSGITMNGETVVNNTNGTQTKTWDRQSLTINPKATAPYTKSSVGSAISILGNSSTVTLNGVTVSGGVTVTGTGTTNSIALSNGTVVTGVITVTGGANSTAAPAGVTINDATAGGYNYTAPSGNTSSSSLIVNAQGRVTGAISTDIGTVALHSANVADVTVKAGTLTIDGTNGTVGDITLGDNSTASKVTLNFSGTNYKVGDITAGTAASLTIGSSWPTGRTNTFGTVDLKNYTGQGIKGGIFKSIASNAAGAAQSTWFSPDLQFMRKFTSGSDTLYAYYGTRELAAAIADAGADAKTSGQISVVGYLANGASAKEVEFYNSLVDISSRANAVAALTYGASTAIYLPDMINGSQVATWTDASTGALSGSNTSTATTFGVNELVSLSSESANVKLVLQSSGAAVTRLTNATTTKPNQNVTVTLSGNQITLSGAVGQAAFEDVDVTCSTDLIGTDGSPVTFHVVVSFNTTTKVATISTLGITPPPQGVVINTSNNTIQVGDNVYTLSVSGLVKPAPNLKVAGIDGTYAYAGSITGKSIVATVTASMGNAAKQTLIDAITGSNAEFDWTGSPAMRQVVNQAMTTITTNNQIDNWATAAQRAAWNQLNTGKTPAESDLWATGYTDVVLEPYLALTVTAFNQSGAMTATLVPSYRVIVVSSDATYTNACKNKNGFTAEGYYIAQAGRALATPLTDLTDVSGNNGVQLTLDGTSTTGLTANTVMHQDGTYAYMASAAGKYLITHAGKTGLGTMVFNTTPALVEMVRSGANTINGKTGTYYYDNLQAAVDDTLPQVVSSTGTINVDQITVKAAYTGSGVISVTGTARAFQITTEGQTLIEAANNNFTVGVDATGHLFTVQLQQSVATTTGEVEIVVTTAANGYATPNVSKAKVGDVVTITVVPANGYKLNAMTALTNTNVTVPVTASTTTNQFTFTVPADVTKITVTPTFVTNDSNTNRAAFAVTPSSQGTAVVATGTIDNTAQQGATVTVTAVPTNSNYRTMGLTARTNTGATVAATRTGTNTFSVTVPAGATTVTVTPSFDVNNGTPFVDVLYSDWASPDVSWLYQNGYTTGYSDSYHFAPTTNATRWEMVYFLYKAAGYPSVTGLSNPFRDVNTSNFYYSAVVWAASKGLIDSSSGYFYPTNPISRADVVYIIWRHKGSPAASTTSGFTDVPASAYYAQAVSWAERMGITNGKSSRTTFKPTDYITRQEIAKMIHVAFG